LSPNQQNAERLPEGILFYNQIIQPFFVNEFGFYLNDLIEPLKFVLKFFILDIDENREASEGLLTKCKNTLAQYNEIALEKIVSQCNLEPPAPATYTTDDVYTSVNELFSFQTYNKNTLDTLKYLQSINMDMMAPQTLPSV